MTSISAMEPARRSSPVHISTCCRPRSAIGSGRTSSDGRCKPPLAQAQTTSANNLYVWINSWLNRSDSEWRLRIPAIELVTLIVRLAEYRLGNQHSHALAHRGVLEHGCYAAW